MGISEMQWRSMQAFVSAPLYLLQTTAKVVSYISLYFHGHKGEGCAPSCVAGCTCIRLRRRKQMNFGLRKFLETIT